MFSVAVNTDIVTSADILCNKESFDAAQKFILVWESSALVWLIWSVLLMWSKTSFFPWWLHGVVFAQIFNWNLKNIRNTYSNSPQERQTFSLWWACFGFEFVRFVSDLYLEVVNDVFLINLATLAILNVKITCGMLFVIKRQDDGLQNNKNNTSPDKFLMFCNESIGLKTKISSYVTHNYVLFIHSFEEVLVKIDWTCLDNTIFFQASSFTFRSLILLSNI